MARNMSFISFNVDSSPEGNTVNSPEDARAAPPEMGASINLSLFSEDCCSRSLADLAQEGDTVEVTTMTAPGLSMDTREE